MRGSVNSKAPAGRGAVGPVVRLVSGGQTGVDRAALDWAMARGLAHGGYCPKGRRAEDGVIAERYRLTETTSESYVERTEQNVLASDGTLVLAGQQALAGGTRLTAELARRHAKPLLVLLRDGPGGEGRRLAEWLRETGVRVLNVAGPRASQDPDIGDYTRRVMDAWAEEERSLSGPSDSL